MLTIRSNIENFYSLPALDDDKFSLEISSDDSTSRNIIATIITQIYVDTTIIYKAYSMPNNINEILNDIGQTNYIYHEGDSHKFYLKKYPELILTIKDKNIIKKLLESWECTSYDGRVFYILKPQCDNLILDFFQNNKNTNHSCLKEIWNMLICAIENIPESNNHDSFIVTARLSFYERIKQILLDYL